MLHQGQSIQQRRRRHFPTATRGVVARVRSSWESNPTLIFMLIRFLVFSSSSIVGDKRPLPPQLPDEEQDAALFDDDPWVEAPVRIEYGTHLRLGANVFINFNAVFLDPNIISIGDRTLIASNVSFMTSYHPLDPELRNGTKGPELAKGITVAEDCWIGSNVSILPGVNVGKGSVVGAGSVVTKVRFATIWMQNHPLSSLPSK